MSACYYGNARCCLLSDCASSDAFVASVASILYSMILCEKETKDGRMYSVCVFVCTYVCEQAVNMDCSLFFIALRFCGFCT